MITGTNEVEREGQSRPRTVLERCRCRGSASVASGQDVKAEILRRLGFVQILLLTGHARLLFETDNRTGIPCDGDLYGTYSASSVSVGEATGPFPRPSVGSTIPRNLRA